MNDKFIGIFDSGIGGLTVLKNLLAVLPDEKYIYIGDNKHCPYGDKTREELFTYACSIIDYLIKRGVKLIVVACNTVSSNILPELTKKYSNIKIIGVIEATTKQLRDINCHNCLVIATNATIDSHAYKKNIEMLDNNINVVEMKTPLLVPLIEKDDKKGVKQVLKDYFAGINNNFDCLVLGCTHYVIIDEIIKQIVPNLKVINSSNGVVLEVKKYLDENNLKSNVGEQHIYTTGDAKQFISSSKCFIDYKKIDVEKLVL